MDISKLSSAIAQSGYNPFGISSTGDMDAQKLAQQNGISVEEAKGILKEAEHKVEENEQLQAETAAMLDMLNSQDEEEIIITDDVDFDNFLNEESPEQKMQEILSQQMFAQKDNSQGQQDAQSSQNFFATGENPFLKMNFQN